MPRFAETPRRLWETYQLSKQMGIRPSELLAVDDDYVAYCLDRAVQTFGNALENRLHEISSKAKNKKTSEQKMAIELDRWLNSDSPNAPGRFRDPALQM